MTRRSATEMLRWIIIRLLKITLPTPQAGRVALAQGVPGRNCVHLDGTWSRRRKRRRLPGWHQRAVAIENQWLPRKELPMVSKRLSSASPGDVPGASGRETPEPAPIRYKTIPGRLAGIIGASFAIAVIAGFLTYYATGKTGAGIAWGFIAVGGAFASAFSFLNGVID